MSEHASPLPLWLHPLLAEAKRRMRRRRLLLGTALVLLGTIAAAAVMVAASPGGPGSPGSGNGYLGSSGQAVGRAFAARGVPVVRVAALPELCDPSACTALLLWGGARPVYLVPRHGRDFALMLFGTAAEARRVGAFDRTHASSLRTDVHGSAVLVYLASTPRTARLRAALRAAGSTD